MLVQASPKAPTGGREAIKKGNKKWFSYNETESRINNGRQWVVGQTGEEKDYDRDLQCSKWHMDNNGEYLVTVSCKLRILKL